MSGVRAAVLKKPSEPLEIVDMAEPEVAGRDVLKLRVLACGVCRTDLHLRDAEIAATKLPVVLGH